MKRSPVKVIAFFLLLTEPHFIKFSDDNHHPVPKY